MQSMQVQGQSEMEVWVRKFTRHFEAHRLQPQRGLTLGTGVREANSHIDAVTPFRSTML